MVDAGSHKKVILTGVSQVDERLGGGIPLGSLCLIEGQSDSGKSVMCQHLTHGTLSTSDISVAYYTTENSVKSLIAQMDSLSLHVLDYFLLGRLRIYPLTIRSELRDANKPFHLLRSHFARLPKSFELVIVDSVTILVSHSNSAPIIDFFSSCKSLCDEGRSIIVVAHSYAFEEEMLSRTRSLCDARFRLRVEQVGDRMVKLLEVLKVHGADRPTGDVISFDVEPKVGMKMIPLSKARV